MDLNSAVRFSLHRLNLEFTSPGSIFSIWSLATSLSIGCGALAWLHWRRRGRTNFRALGRAIFGQNLWLRESTLADVQLFIISVVFMPVNIIAGIGGMSEFSMMTNSIPWQLAYGCFILVMIAIGLFTFIGLRAFENKRIEKLRSENSFDK